VAELLANPIALLAALLAAAGMGYAIHQGGTCMVAAIEQLVRHRSAKKLVALAECGLWTSALGLAAAAAGLSFAASPAYPLGVLTIAGGLLLGFGAWLNGACVFGSIAKIGGRDWHYLLTPPGFFLGSLAHAWLVGGFATAVRQPASYDLAPLLVVLVLASLAASWRGWRSAGRSPGSLWDYRHATIAIGLCFVVLAVLAGPWTYTETLGRAAHGGGFSSWHEAALFAALLAGALLGGRRAAGQITLAPRRAMTCLAGGALMGFGGALVPGGNDNLILVGLPGLQPHALVAIAAMVLAIALAMKGAEGLRRLRLGASSGNPGPV
jgi:Sulphur transport